MKVLYDHQIFTVQEYGGISRIYTELLNTDGNQNNYNPELSIVFSNNHYLTELENIHYRNFLSNRYFPRKVQLMNIVNRAKTISKLKSSKFDVFHPTYYDPYFLPYIKAKPFVVTFLDMIHEKFGNQYKELAQDKAIFLNKQQLINQATGVIAISESTKNDLIEHFQITPERIEVIHLATSLKKASGTALIQGEYFLFVGRRERYKNFSLLVEAISSLLIQNKEVKLISAGGGAFLEEELNLFNKLGISKQVVQVPFNNDDALANLYTNAVAFIFPSLYEGFGIPILEAFACNCPAILSNTSSLPEVGGHAAAYFDPYDANSMLQKIEQVFFDQNYRRSLIEAGSKRLQEFSWQQTRNKTEELYANIVKHTA